MLFKSSNKLAEEKTYPIKTKIFNRVKKFRFLEQKYLS